MTRENDRPPNELVPAQPLDEFWKDSIGALDRLRAALGHIGTNLELELANTLIAPGRVDEDSQAALHEIRKRLAEIGRHSYKLTASISAAVGESDESIVPDEELGTIASLAQPKRLRLSDTGTEESAPTRKAIPTAEALHQGFADPAQFPDPVPTVHQEELELVYLTDFTCKLDGAHIELRASLLMYIFNALFLLRDKPRSSRELRSLGFAGGKTSNSSKTLFIKSMHALQERLYTATGRNIITTLGRARGTLYALAYVIHVTDARRSRSPEPGPPPISEPKLDPEPAPSSAMPPPPPPPIEPPAPIPENPPPPGREQILAEIASCFRKSGPEFTRRLRTYAQEQGMLIMPTTPEGKAQLRPLKPKEIGTLFLLINRGIHIYENHGLDPGSERLIVSLSRAAIAQELLFISHAKLITKILASLNLPPTTEVNNTGKRALLQAIRTFGLDDAESFAEYANRCIRTAIQDEQNKNDNTGARD